MCGVGFSDSRRNVEVNVKGENTLRGKQLQLPNLYLVRVLHYCCEKGPWSELGEGVMSILRTRHQP